jgi:hypothetical protein
VLAWEAIFVCLFYLFLLQDKFLVYCFVTWYMCGRLCLYVYLIHFWVNLWLIVFIYIYMCVDVHEIVCYFSY